MKLKSQAYIGLGSNLGDKGDNIADAIKALSQVDGIEVLRTSDVIQTKALGDAGGEDYLNGVAEIETALSPDKLLAVLQRIEDSLGRERKDKAKWSPRTIDLDLLLFGDEIIDTAVLTVPHSQMHLRSFVLQPMCQLRPSLVHPVLGVSMEVLAERLGGGDFFVDSQNPQLISIAGIIGVGKTTLAEKISGRFGCPFVNERYDTNPFLADVYAGEKDKSLCCQLYFLISRTEQLNPAILAAGESVIADYVFEKELVYARRLLDEDALAAYEKLYEPFAQKVVRPQLVVYLTDTAENCLERIHLRNRPYEQKIEQQLMEGYRDDYGKLFENWKRTPVIRIDASKLDYTKADTLNDLLTQIRAYIAI